MLNQTPTELKMQVYQQYCQLHPEKTLGELQEAGLIEGNKQGGKN